MKNITNEMIWKMAVEIVFTPKAASEVLACDLGVVPSWFGEIEQGLVDHFVREISEDIDVVRDYLEEHGQTDAAIISKETGLKKEFVSEILN